MRKAIVVISLSISLFSCNYTNEKIIDCATILEKERILSEESSYYLIYTDKGEFTIQDELFRGNFKSSKWYGKLQKNKIYSFKVGGYRNGVLSMYPNIHSNPIECK